MYLSVPLLFNYLELTGFYDVPVFIPQLVNINTPVEIVKIEIIPWSDIFYFPYFFTNEIIYLKGKRLIIPPLKIKIDI